MLRRARDTFATPGRHGEPPAPDEDALATASAAGGLLVVAVVALALAVAETGGALVVETITFGAASLAALGLGAVARRGGDKRAAYAGDLLALLLLSAQLLAGGDRVAVLLGFLLLPIAHAAAFFTPLATAGLVATAIGLAAVATTMLGGGLPNLLSWVAPAAFAAGLASLPVDQLRRERRWLVDREAEARRLADEDGLTGLSNYRAFWRALEAETARAQRHGQPFTLVILDLDHFKRVNDEHGHLVGDEVLRTVAAALRETVRAEDLVARQGGDEFAVIAVAAGLREADALARRLVNAVNERADNGRFSVGLTASAGWATFGEPARSPETLVDHAEAGLRAAKRVRPGERAVASGPAAPIRSAGASVPRVATAHARGHAARPGVRLSVLANLARALAGATTERAIAETALAHVAGAIDADRVAIVRRGRGDAGLALVAVSGGRGAREPRQPPDRPPVSTAIRQRRPVVINVAPGDLPGAYGGSSLAVPLLSGGDVWGALELESGDPTAFATAEVELLDAMGETIGRTLTVAHTLAELAGARWDSDEGPDLATARTDAHGRDVARLAERVGRRLGMSPQELRQLYLAALFHDIGMVCAPPGVLRKQGELTDEEFAALRPAPLVGQRLLAALPGLDLAAEIVRAARERYDGGGYPLGLSADEIPPAARVLHACDAYVAMTTPRPYRPSLDHDAALEELRRGAASQFDPDVVDALFSVIEPRAEASTG